METIKLRAHIGKDGILKVDTPTQYKNVDAEIVIVLQPQMNNDATDEMGWPVGYFEETYGILADDPIERGDQGDFETREILE